ncbi:MAG: 3-deoxy-manno-octulosonate cytidylyltransferase [Steroidobacteraceae bacterium]
MASIAGRPLIQWVWDCARNSGAASVTIATDDDRICRAATDFGADWVMTDARHSSGTDRVAEVVTRRSLAAEDIIVNLQGDEPLMPPAVICEVASALCSRTSADVATAVAPIATLGEFLDSNCVKALRALDGRALYFSRAPVPWPREHAADGVPTAFAGAWRHIGIYAYRVRTLLAFAAWPPTAIEDTEKLEQLRALEHGMHVHLVTLAAAPGGGVDTADDLARVRRCLEQT